MIVRKPFTKNTNKLEPQSQILKNKIIEIKRTSQVNPQREKGHVRTCNSVFEALRTITCQFKSPVTRAVIDEVERETWGWNHKYASIKNEDFVRHLCTYLRAVQRGIKEAESRNVILVDRSQRINIYAMNKHYDTWVWDAGVPDVGIPEPETIDEEMDKSDDK